MATPATDITLIFYGGRLTAQRTVTDVTMDNILPVCRGLANQTLDGPAAILSGVQRRQCPFCHVSFGGHGGRLIDTYHTWTDTKGNIVQALGWVAEVCEMDDACERRAEEWMKPESARVQGLIEAQGVYNTRQINM